MDRIRLSGRDENNPCMVITMDQIVLFKEKIREKPENEAEALEYLSSYSNDYLSTISAVAVTYFPSGLQKSGVDISTLSWRYISPEVVQKVVNKGEIYSSAGGFRIEDPDLNGLIKDLEGSVDSVMGFPVLLTERLIAQLRYEERGETPSPVNPSPLRQLSDRFNSAAVAEADVMPPPAPPVNRSIHVSESSTVSVESTNSSNGSDPKRLFGTVRESSTSTDAIWASANTCVTDSGGGGDGMINMAQHMDL